MGSDNSKCVVGVRTEGDVFYTGDNVDGTVYVKVPDMASSIRPKQLDLRFIVTEYASVQYTSQARTDNVHHDRAELILLDKTFVMKEYKNCMIKPGDYEHPFRINIPTGFPPSMKYQHIGSDCMIEYRLIVSMLDRKSRRIVRTIEHIEVKSKAMPYMMKQILPVIPEPKTKSTRICCFFNRKGTMTLAAETQKDKFKENDEAIIAYNFQNDTNEPIKGIDLCFVQQICWQGLFSHHRLEVSRLYGDYLQIENGTSCPVDFNKTMNRYTNQINNYVKFKIQKSKTRKNEDTSLWDKVVLIPSYEGKYIQIRHYFLLTVTTKRSMVSNLRLRLPIYLLPTMRETDPSNITKEESLRVSREMAKTEEELNALYDDIIEGREVQKEKDRFGGLPEDWKGLVQSMRNLKVNPYEHDEEKNNEKDKLEKAKKSKAFTIEALHKRLSTRISNYLVLKHVVDKEKGFHPLLRSLVPAEFAKIVSMIDFSPDKVAASELLAKIIQPGNFSCEYICAVISVVESYERVNLTRTLAPLANDLDANKDMIKRKLDYFEIEQCKEVLDAQCNENKNLKRRSSLYDSLNQSLLK